jgi:ligand-binding SRPBCC domain-containing protein
MERIDNIFTVSEDIHAVWSFFINPASVSELEPPELSLEFTELPLPEKAYNGYHIRYKLTPLDGLEINVDSVFQEIEPPYFYVTEMTNALFEYWRYEHFFRPLKTGHTEIKDVIYFKPIPGKLGQQLDMVKTQQQIMKILQYREAVCRKKWG